MKWKYCILSFLDKIVSSFSLYSLTEILPVVYRRRSPETICERGRYTVNNDYRNVNNFILIIMYCTKTVLLSYHDKHPFHHIFVTTKVLASAATSWFSSIWNTAASALSSTIWNTAASAWSTIWNAWSQELKPLSFSLHRHTQVSITSNYTG